MGGDSPLIALGDRMESHAPQMDIDIKSKKTTFLLQGMASFQEGVSMGVTLGTRLFPYSPSMKLRTAGNAILH